MRIKYLFQIILHFIKTIAYSTILVSVWILITETDIYKMLWESNNVEPVMPVAIGAIIICLAFDDYHTDSRRINYLLKKLL